ncbi:TIR domain-containing protein [Aeromonas rivipollensis]|uniref:TIR domain-containing protein n=1 Tax=Aeromonas rivipollensis TaxID=948519 RepID=UPI003D1BFF9C
MKKEEVLGILQDNGFVLDEEKSLPYGVQFSFRNGAKVNVFDKGTVTPQGQHIDLVKALLGVAAPNGGAVPVGATVATRKKVFVVYGHDVDSRAQLEAMLRRWDLEPLILDQLPSEGQTIIEKLEKHTSEANFAVILATPDDIGFRDGHEDEKAYRARQNVVLELGMMLAKLGRKNVAILLKQQANMERPSDIQGLIYIPFKDSVTDGSVLLAKEMAAQGYRIDIGRL